MNLPEMSTLPLDDPYAVGVDEECYGPQLDWGYGIVEQIDDGFALVRWAFRGPPTWHRLRELTPSRWLRCYSDWYNIDRMGGQRRTSAEREWYEENRRGYGSGDPPRVFLGGAR